MLLLTCTVSMVLHLPETPVQLSMVPRSVCRAPPTGLFISSRVCVEGKRGTASLLFKRLLLCLQLCGSLGRLSQQLCRRVGFQIIPVSFVF